MADLGIWVKEKRMSKGLSQKQLSEISGLSINIIQKIENGEGFPRSDALNRLAMALQVKPEDIHERRFEENRNVLTILNLSQAAFLIFPAFGILVPFFIWVLKRDKIRKVSTLGKAILNFQITWTLFLMISYFGLTIIAYRYGSHSSINFLSLTIAIVALLYVYNATMIIVNSIDLKNNNPVNFKPALRFIR
jgi:uncharacterized Tic20 family protein